MDNHESLIQQVTDYLQRRGFNDSNAINDIRNIILGFFNPCCNLSGKDDISHKIELFLTAKNIDGLSPKSLVNYKNMLMIMANFIDKRVASITANDIRSFVLYLKETRNIKETTQSTYIHVMQSLFKWLEEEEIITKNPCIKIKSPKINRKQLVRALTLEELERLRNCCVTNREKAMIEFFYSTGCRLSEAIRIKVSQIDFNMRSVKVLGKGNKERVVYFSIKAKLYMQEYLTTRKGDCEYLFTSSIKPYGKLKSRIIQQIVRGIGRKAGIEQRVHPHMLRHTFATAALKSGMDVVIIQQLLGHENVSTTQIYAEINPEVVRHAYDKLIA